MAHTFGITTAQNLVADAVRRRGYREGLTTNQFAARNIAKLFEEAGELAEHFELPERLKVAIKNVREIAAEEFKRGDWTNAGIRSLISSDYGDNADEYHRRCEEARKELADVQVVVFNIAHAFGFDVSRAAVDKADADVARGVQK